MIYNLSNLYLLNFVYWSKLFRKRLNHEHIALYSYLCHVLISKNIYSFKKDNISYLMIYDAQILNEIPTIRNKKTLYNLLDEMSPSNILSYFKEQDTNYFYYFIEPIPYFFFYYKGFEQLSDKQRTYFLKTLAFLIQDPQIDLDNSSLLLKTNFFTLLNDFNCIRDDNNAIFEELSDLLIDNQKEIVKEFNLSKFVANEQKRNLTDEEFNILYPAVKIWNEASIQNTLLTKHRIYDIVNRPVGKQLIKISRILLDIENQNFSALPEVFTVFENRTLTVELLQKAIDNFCSVIKWKNTKNKISFLNFLYNPMKNFSWLCNCISFSTSDYNRRKSLNSVYRAYESLLNHQGEIPPQDRRQVVIAVNQLKNEFEKIKKTIGWFNQQQDPKYNLNSWNMFTDEHILFLQNTYGQIKINMIKPVLNNGKFTLSYTKFIDYVSDTYRKNLYPSAKEMQLMLKLRALILKKEELLSTEHPFLTEDEYKLYMKKEIQLLYDDN